MLNLRHWSLFLFATLPKNVMCCTCPNFKLENLQFSFHLVCNCSFSHLILSIAFLFSLYLQLYPILSAWNYLARGSQKFKQMKRKYSRQGLMLQVCVSWASPLQGLPPFDGEGWEQVLVLCCDPPSQLLSQSAQSDQEDQPPSTGSTFCPKIPAINNLIFFVRN